MFGASANARAGYGSASARGARDTTWRDGRASLN